MGGKTSIGSTIKNCIEFNVEGTAVVTVWWVCAGDNRTVSILDESGAKIHETDPTAKDKIMITTFTIEAAGKYYLANVVDNNYIFKVEVVDTVVSE